MCEKYGVRRQKLHHHESKKENRHALEGCLILSGINSLRRHLRSPAYVCGLNICGGLHDSNRPKIYQLIAGMPNRTSGHDRTFAHVKTFGPFSTSP